MFLVEIGKSLHRVRTWVFAAGLAGLAALPVLILTLSSDDSGGPPFFDLIDNNGLFATVTAIALIQPFVLPLGTGLLAGEAMAGEASAGTLRYLLVRPVERKRLVLVKYASVVAQVGAAIAWVIVIALVTGGLAFGYGPLPTLSGATLPAAEGILRILAVGAYALCGMSGLAAIGIFFSTITDSGPGATVATVALAITSQILGGLASLRAIHPYLLTDEWFSFVDLFRSPVAWGGIVHGLILAGAYTVIFLTAAVALFARKDVAS